MEQSLLIQLGVKECLLQGNDKGTDHELAKLKMLVERCGVIVTERKAGESKHLCDRLISSPLSRLCDKQCGARSQQATE